jgi:hypothetical protein
VIVKYTGWAVLIIGVLIGAFGLFSMAPTAPTPPADSTPAGPPVSLGVVLLGFSAVAVLAGVAILLFGGKGVIKTKNLAVRN